MSIIHQAAKGVKPDTDECDAYHDNSADGLLLCVHAGKILHCSYQQANQ